jgi:hypothetical protein
MHPMVEEQVLGPALYAIGYNPDPVDVAQAKPSRRLVLDRQQVNFMGLPLFLPGSPSPSGAARLSAASDVRSSQALHPREEEEGGCRMPPPAKLAPAGAGGSSRPTPAPVRQQAGGGY